MAIERSNTVSTENMDNVSMDPLYTGKSHVVLAMTSDDAGAYIRCITK